MNALPLRRRLALELFRLYRHSETAEHKLTYFFWECTLRCNLHCMHCGSDCLRDGKPDMPAADFLNVLDGLHGTVDLQKTFIVITGGEPLMRADLEDIGEELRKRGFRWGMVTNGFAMTEDRFRAFLRAGLRSITVSLDGLQRSHDKFRGHAESFERALNAISLAAHTPGLIYDVMTCVNKENLPELPELRDLLVKTGVKRWRITAVFPKGRAAGNPLFDLSVAEYRQILDFIRETRTQGQIRTDYSCEGFLGAYEGVARESPFFCRAGVNVASVLADGSISACPSLRGDYIQGNIYRDDFRDVWQNRFQVMRDRSWARTGECEKCKHWRYCEGGSLHLRDERTRELIVRCRARQMDAAKL